MNLAAKEENGSTTGKAEGKAITMAMIAKAAGVSQGAISSLLNDRDYGIRVSSKTRERVFRVCREMHYIPNDLRAVVRMYPEKGDLCLLVEEDAGLEDPLADRFAKALLREYPEHHVTVAFYDPTGDYSNPESTPEPVRTGVASRFITLGTPNLSLFATIAAREFAMVHIGQETQAPGVTSILPDYAAAARQGIEYLFRLGHRQIAILSGPFGSTDPAIIELNHGIRAGYDAIKTPIEAQNVIYGDATFEHGAASVDLLWERPRKPTAIFCFNDLVAAGVLHRAQENGLKIPQDLSVMGCGDAMFSPWLHPPLNTVAFSAPEMAAQALAEVQRRLQEQDFTSVRKIGIPSRVVERASCAKPPGE
jgi:DNA-binding LacI/PurR family transcriptional regulator